MQPIVTEGLEPTFMFDVGSPPGTLGLSTFQFACASGDESTVQKCLEQSSTINELDPSVVI